MAPNDSSVTELSLQKSGAPEGCVEAAFILTKEPSKCLDFLKLFCLFSNQQVVIYPCYLDLLLTATISLLNCFLLISCGLGNSETVKLCGFTEGNII